MAVYADLLRFKNDLLDRVAREILTLPEVAQRAAPQDLDVIREHMQGYEARFDSWYQRVWDLQGLWIEPDGDIVRHQGGEVALTKRERHSELPAGSSTFSLVFREKRPTPTPGG